MIHITICVKTDLDKAQSLSSAGIILRYIPPAMSTQNTQEIEKCIGVFFGNCTNYNAYARALLVAIVSIKQEFKVKESIKFLFDKKTHVSNILSSNKKDEVIMDLKKHLLGVDIELASKTDEVENKLLVRAAALANDCLYRKDSIV